MLKESNLATKAKPTEHAYVRTPKKIVKHVQALVFLLQRLLQLSINMKKNYERFCEKKTSTQISVI